MTRHHYLDRSLWFIPLMAVPVVSCGKSQRDTFGPSTGGASVSSGGGDDEGGTNAGAGGRDRNGSGGETAEVAPTPKYYPVPGFEDCVHAEVKADCEGGWCMLPPSCFVMGSPEDEWHRGRDSENQTAVTLTRSIEVQQEELTRSEWEAITQSPAPGPDLCNAANCPVAMVSWWDAVHAANLLSEHNGLAHCYEPVNCTGTLGIDLTCEGVADPDKSVYECEGYRLPTRAEAEYAARAGTISTFYSGDITPYSPDNVCAVDPALELIAWYCNNSGDRPHVGGELAPNGYGLYDMIGNLGEWSNEGQLGASSPGGRNPQGEVGANTRRLRFSPQYDVKSYLTRTASLLSVSWGDRGSQLGFRLYRTLFEDSERSKAIVSEK